VAVKIKLKRMGKIRAPYYRIVIADSRTKRDGRAIEEIGKYHPKSEPSLIEVDSDRAQHWLSVGAQPTDPVRKILEITGDWQKFKGLPGAEGTLRVAEPKADRKEAFAAAVAENLVESGAKAKAKAKPETKPAADKAPAKARKPADKPAEGAETAAPVAEAAEPVTEVAEPAAEAEAPAPVAEAAEPEAAEPEAPVAVAAAAEPEAAAPAADEADMLEEALEHLVKGIVEHPDDVQVGSRGLRRGRVLEVRVHPDDLGKVIGRGGRTARALRTVVGSLAGNNYVRVDLLDADEVR
jgi:small subunit ribosomal protein S16